MDVRTSVRVIIHLTIVFGTALTACSQIIDSRRLENTALPLTGLNSAVLTTENTDIPASQVSKTPIRTQAVSSDPTATPLIQHEQTQGIGGSSASGCLISIFDDVSESATVFLGPSPGIPASTVEGEQLVIIGTVFDRSCNPLPGANLTVHQTDANGEYGPGHGSESLQCCYLQGQGKTDEKGRYKLVTIIPGHYAGENPPPPAHIHMEVSHPQGGEKMTEILFAGDPFLQAFTSADTIIVQLEAAGNPDQGFTFQRGVADVRLPGGSSIETAPTSAGSRTFQIDPKRSQAAYHILEKFNRLPIQIGSTGVSSLVDGEIEIDIDDPHVLRFMDVRVDLRGLKSDDPSRDEKLFDRWLVTDQYPYASFESTRLEGLPEGFAGPGDVSFKLWGNLTIRDVTREVPFVVSARLVGNTLSGTATTRIMMTDFGIDPPNLLDFVVVEDQVELIINIVAVEKEQ